MAIVSYFYDGMSSLMRQLLETVCGGDFMSKYPEEAMDLLSYVAEVSRGWDEPSKGEVGKMKSQPNAFNAKARMYTLNEDVDMKAKFAAMARRLEELELKRYMKYKLLLKHQCKSSHVLFVNLMSTWWRSALQFQLQGKCLENKQMSLDNSSPTTMLRMEILTTQVGGTIQIFLGSQEHLTLITLRSGKKVELPTPKPHVEEEEEEEIDKREEIKGKKKDISEGKEDHYSTVNANSEKVLIKEEMLKKHTPPPFPQALHGKKGIRNASEILESPLKYKDPGCPTISIMIGRKVVAKALLDLGASVNFLPYSVYKQLGLGELMPTSITLSLVDRSVKIPRGIIKDVLVQVDNFYYPVDSVVLDTHPIVKETNYVPIILGRPFLATSNAIINCRNGLMQLTFGNMTLELNIFYMSKKLITPKKEENPEEVCIIDTLVEEHCNQNMQDKLNESLGDLEEGLPEPLDVLATLQGWRRREEILPDATHEEAQEATKEETPKLNLKPLPTKLKYTYLEENKQCPVVISSSLTTPPEKCLLEVLKRCKKAIGWQISDLKGISPLVVRAEVLKLLQASIIYPISDSPWVSPTQVVPKKSGIAMVQNEKGEEIATRLTSGTPGIFKSKSMLKIRRRPLSHVHLEHTPTEECLLVYVFMDDITLYGGTFEECLVNLEAVLNKCIEKDLVLNWEKCHFMVHQGIVLGHIISEKGIEVDKAKVELIVKLPSPTTVKGVRQFLGHAGFYRRFIKDFFKISKPFYELLAKEAKFIWDEGCQKSFDQLKQLNIPIGLNSGLEVIHVIHNCNVWITFGAISSHDLELFIHPQR
ncbi:Retrovirus-related Pol polyprotein from transposon 412 [Vitis vinifera]|uniref:Retrovirus-related Pol polyprotein from transposon 412 n=1 Tax=Vitis vinifera TaxID=29760 RepID=A0A438FPY1_VITVI|nr:Retrovirus-related Pol polyprotein from transposon 412 [Vitis vinifera]